MNTITIVGGGTSGWMTAVLLNQAYNKFGQTVKVRLIESPDIDIVGVGEATVPAIKDFLQAVGIDEMDFMKHTNATIKTGILFKNWCAPSNDGQVHTYMHPFDQEKVEKRLDVATSWLLSERRKPYDQSVSIAHALAQKNLTPKVMNSKSFQSIVPYSYHLDARLFGQYLRDYACAKGVERIEAHVSSVNSSGNIIDSLETTKGTFKSDYFIDCTGFRGLLISQVDDDSNWHSYRDSLFCDRAVTVQTPHEAGYSSKSYTESYALNAGWAWKIDLQNRTGNGYVYSSRYIDSKTAENEFRAHLNLPDGTQFNHIEMKVGRRKQQWVGNCVSVGLSSGFIEPLESTGLHLIYLAARFFVLHNNFSGNSQSNIDNFNLTMCKTYDELKDFIVLHYVLSDRKDTEFWRDVHKTLDFCPELSKRLELWKSKVCEFFDVSDSTSHMFSDTSYRYILYGMNYFPELKIPTIDGEFEDIFQYLDERKKQACNAVLSHSDFINKIQGKNNFVSVKL